MGERTRIFKVHLCALLSGYTADFFNKLPDKELEKEYSHLLISEIANSQLKDYENERNRS